MSDLERVPALASSLAGAASTAFNAGPDAAAGSSSRMGRKCDPNRDERGSNPGAEVHDEDRRPAEHQDDRQRAERGSNFLLYAYCIVAATTPPPEG